MTAGGTSVSGSSSYSYSPYISRQHYIGANASAEMQPATTYYDNSLVISGGDAPGKVGAGRPVTQFPAQVDGFVDAVREGREHLTPGEMGYRDIVLIEAMYRSADAGGAVARV